MSQVLTVILVWVACGVFAAGFLRQHNRYDRCYWFKQADNYEDVATCIGFGFLFGPIILVVSFFTTGFWHHGWSLNKDDYVPSDHHLA